MKGLYIHIPFCSAKCDYCDFYSISYDGKIIEKYVSFLKEKINSLTDSFDTVYFGGGTPSIIGGDNIADILSCVKLNDNAEVTVECNPNSATAEFFSKIAAKGVNRVSIGLQSANSEELKFLTRKHSPQDAAKAVQNAKAAGITNISLDVMLGLYNQTEQTLIQTLNFCTDLDVTHISAYMLHIEPSTPMSRFDESLLPDGDEQARLYLSLCEQLNKKGYEQYEISNFSKSGYRCRHNMIYWNCDEYLGLGPAAHSFYKGKRFYYPRDIEYFINDNPPIDDGEGGGFNEYVMLRLRLSEGLIFDQLKQRGFTLDKSFIDKCCLMQKQGLLTMDEQGIRLNSKGFLVQNLILDKLL
ncbi:MAG: radical SAM family heme chaperone HemW [Clostridia bacterium]|nr:radical SAM family heme chaperone HemW [Clostridia bacterium]